MEPGACQKVVHMTSKAETLGIQEEREPVCPVQSQSWESPEG